MKLRIALLTALVLSVAGCASTQAWWQSFKSDPVATVHSFEARTMAYVNTAEAIIEQVLPVLGDQAPAIQKRLAAAKLAVSNSLAVLEDGVATAADLAQDPPNWSKAIADVLSAADSLQAVVDDVKSIVSGKPVMAAGAPQLTLVGYDDLLAQRRGLERYRK